PVVELEFIAGKRQRRAVVVVLLALPRRRQRIHHAIFDAVEIQMLLTHELVIAGRQPAVRRPGIAARRLRLRLRIGKAFDIAVVRARAVSLRIIPPAIAQIRPIILDRGFGMNVAVDDLQLGLGAAVDLAGFDVHGASSVGPGGKSIGYHNVSFSAMSPAARLPIWLCRGCQNRTGTGCVSLQQRAAEPTFTPNQNMEAGGKSLLPRPASARAKAAPRRAPINGTEDSGSIATRMWHADARLRDRTD